MICTSCDQDSPNAIIQLNGAGKLVPCCPCGQEYPPDAAAAPREPVAVGRPSAVDLTPSRVPVVATRPQSREPLDPIAIIRERLTFVDEEVNRLAALKLEQRRLKKMLAAADKVKPPPPAIATERPSRLANGHAQAILTS